MASSPVSLNVNSWIDQNRQYFQPPVCAKLMHEGQLNIMFVGGPNNRSDYHIESGEELFLQLKGNMLLKVVERNQHRDIFINEGEIFLLPRAIPHSPQRFPDTVGLVVERSRKEGEIDGLRFYASEGGVVTMIPLYEAWFEWDKDRSRMAEFFKEFHDSEQYKTGKPIPGTIPEKSPTEVDTVTKLQSPFKLINWIENNMQSINSKGKLALFETENHQIQAYVYGKGDNSDCFPGAQAWIWQLAGESRVKVGSDEYVMKKDDSILIPAGQRFQVKQDEASTAFVCAQFSYQPDESGQHVTLNHG